VKRFVFVSVSSCAVSENVTCVSVQNVVERLFGQSKHFVN
jgi:hypothetical protein